MELKGVVKLVTRGITADEGKLTLLHVYGNGI